MARPRKQPHEQRTASIRISLTEAEKLFVQDQAENADLPVADYARRRLLKTQVRIPKTRINSLLLHKLNQLAVQLHNLPQDPSNSSPITSLAKDFSEALEALALHEY